MKIFNKLVRDKIPQIIESNNEICHVEILDEKTYLEKLNEKLQEEMREYLESGEIEELADLEEVLRAILKAKKVEHDDFEKIRIKKVEKRGAFEKRLFLKSTEEK